MTLLIGAAFSVPCVKRPDLLSGLSFCTDRPGKPSVPTGQRCTLARGLAQPGFLGIGAAISRFKAYGADPDIGFARLRKSLPVTGTFAGLRCFTTKDLRHGWKLT